MCHAIQRLVIEGRLPTDGKLQQVVQKNREEEISGETCTWMTDWNHARCLVCFNTFVMSSVPGWSKGMLRDEKQQVQRSVVKVLRQHWTPWWCTAQLQVEILATVLVVFVGARN